METICYIPNNFLLHPSPTSTSPPREGKCKHKLLAIEIPSRLPSKVSTAFLASVIGRSDIVIAKSRGPRLLAQPPQLRRVLQKSPQRMRCMLGFRPSIRRKRELPKPATRTHWLSSLAKHDAKVESSPPENAHMDVRVAAS